jgi:hypothetical protein
MILSVSKIGHLYSPKTLLHAAQLSPMRKFFEVSASRRDLVLVGRASTSGALSALVSPSTNQRAICLPGRASAPCATASRSPFRRGARRPGRSAGWAGLAFYFDSPSRRTPRDMECGPMAFPNRSSMKRHRLETSKYPFRLQSRSNLFKGLEPAEIGVIPSL